MSAWVPIPPWAAALTGLVLTAALNRSRVDLFGAVEAGLSACKVAVLGLVMLLAVISALRSGGGLFGSAGTHHVGTTRRLWMAVGAAAVAVRVR